jgi:hypothetical protein
MPAPKHILGSLVFAALLCLQAPASAQTRDVPGARDYPGIGRFTGSVITGYVV